MNQFVKEGGIIIVLSLEPFPRWYADTIFTRGIEGMRHAVLYDRWLGHMRHNVFRLGYAISSRLYYCGPDF